MVKLNLQLFAKKQVDDTVVNDVISGKYGNGQARKTALTNAGYDYSEVQSAVNAKLSGKSTTTTTSTTNKNTSTTTTPTTNTFKTSDTTNAYKNTSTQKQTELDNLGTFTYDEYVQPDSVTAAYDKLNALQKPGEFQYGNQQMLDEVFNKIMNGEEFSYDLNGDALYQQYKDQFTTQGKLASQDVMGQAAAMTGGYGNSYAQSVGQQAYQGYLQQLNDKVPELYQLALEKHNMDRQELKDQYGMLLDDRNYAYGIHRDSVSDYLTERDYLTEDARWQSQDAWDKYTTGQDQRFNEFSTEYGIINDALDRADANYWKSYDVDYNKYSDESSKANDIAFAMLNLGQMPSAALLSAAGISSADAQKIVNAVEKEKKSSGSSGSGGGSSKGSKSAGDSYDTHGYSTDQIKSIQEQAGIKVDGIWGPNTQAAYASGIRPKEASGFEGEFGDYDVYDKNNQASAKASLNREFKIHPESQHDAVMRATYGSYKQYIAYMIDKSLLNDGAKVACALAYGLSESDFDFKPKK